MRVFGRVTVFLLGWSKSFRISKLSVGMMEFIACAVVFASAVADHLNVNSVLSGASCPDCSHPLPCRYPALLWTPDLVLTCVARTSYVQY